MWTLSTDTVLQPISDFQFTIPFSKITVASILLSLLYFMLSVYVLRNLLRLVARSHTWNSLRILCTTLTAVCTIRCFAFLVIFVFSTTKPFAGEQGNTENSIYNTLFIVPSLLVVFTYMMLLCNWAEITMFSRDQFLVTRSQYSFMWKLIYGIVTSVILIALIIVLVLLFSTKDAIQYQAILHDIFTALWIINFVLPGFCIIIWAYLTFRLAGFPYIDSAWQLQVGRMNRVVLVWTLGRIIDAVMVLLWGVKKQEWDVAIIQLTVVATLICSEMFPIAYVTEWGTIGLLLLSFENWRARFRENTNGTVRSPLLSETSVRRNAESTSSVLSSAGPPISSGKTSYGSRKPSRRKLSFDWDTLTIDRNFFIKNYSHLPYVTTNKAHCSDRDVCVRIFRQDALSTQALNDLVREVSQRSDIVHQHVIELYGVFEKDNSLYIVTEWMQKGSLYDIIRASPKDTHFATRVVLRIAKQIAETMHWLHSNKGVVHGYLKSRNILFDDHMNIKIGDIGLSPLKAMMGMMVHDADFDGYWTDPEFYRGSPVTEASDVWAFGFILYEMVTKKSPYEDLNGVAAIQKAIRSGILPQIPAETRLNYPNFLLDAIHRCWTTSSEGRITFGDIVQLLTKNM